jgi:hypothetical protein
MAKTPDKPEPPSNRPEVLLDENGLPTGISEDGGLVEEAEAAVEAAGPSGWWLYGLIGLAVIIAILLVLQMLGSAPG